MDRSFLGRGWSFPPTFDDQGRAVRMVEAEEDIRQSLAILMSTHLGERVMRPTFGWRRDDLTFAPMTTTFAGYLQKEIETAVLFFETRVRVDGVRFEQLASPEGMIEMRLDYTIRATNTRANLVFPFYRGEATVV